MNTTLSRYQIQELAVEACADPRTVQRVLEGKPVASTSAVRIASAAKSLGIELPPLRTARASGPGRGAFG
jgi:hypothetical protein